MSERRPILKLRFGVDESPAVAGAATDDGSSSQGDANSIDPIRVYDCASDDDRRCLETHVLVGLLSRAAQYAISSEFHPEYAARASEDVAAAMLRLWQEVSRFMAQPDESRASEITKLVRQIINAGAQERQASALTLAIRRAAQLANATERERTVMERYGKNGEG
jgi:hypothetical protein